MMKIGILIGSLSQKSYSRKIAQFIVNSFPNIAFMELNYRQLSLYDPDLEVTNCPINWQAFRLAIRKFNALLFVTPEYNYSIPGGLKNALDILSGADTEDLLIDKPTMIITDSSGNRGGLIANLQLQQVLRMLGMRVFNNEVTLSNVQELFNDQDELIDQSSRDFLIANVTEFYDFIKHN